MFGVVITTADSRTFRCPAINTGPSFLTMLGVASITLGKAIPLNNGTVHRSFRLISRQTTRVDLSDYQELFLSNHQWFGRIEPV